MITSKQGHDIDGRFYGFAKAFAGSYNFMYANAEWWRSRWVVAGKIGLWKLNLEQEWNLIIINFTIIFLVDRWDGISSIMVQLWYAIQLI